MLKALEVLYHIDGAITDTLTKFCWWTDIHYNKDNVWWSKVVLACIYPILWTIQVYLELEQNLEEIMTTLFAVFLCVWVFSYCIFSYFSSTQRMIKNAKMSPNSNRISPGIFLVKIWSPFSASFFWIFPNIIPYQTSKVFDFATIVSVELFLYILCTEPIPPAVKRKKLEELEIKRLQYIPQKN